VLTWWLQAVGKQRQWVIIPDNVNEKSKMNYRICRGDVVGDLHLDCSGKILYDGKLFLRNHLATPLLEII
jgi:hypothetical protein